MDVSGPKISVRNTKSVSFGDETLDLSCVEQLIEISQTRAISDALQHIKSQVENGRFKSKAVVDIAIHLETEIDSKVGSILVLLVVQLSLQQRNERLFRPVPNSHIDSCRVWMQ